ncbi:hydroxymethylglutaryl-CoA lyase [Microdochium nivale]|nr:hydroxymethylglutaryl-CoA lyase [Microdochium nivale]
MSPASAAPAAKVRIIEVGPRDGLQNIAESIPTATKLELIHRLRQNGLQTIELTSVVSPRAVPQLKDCRQVLSHASMQGFLKHQGYRLPVLVPNIKGFQIAQQLGVKEVAVFISASEGFSRANTNRTVGEGVAASRAVCQVAGQHNVAVRGYLSCVFSDPYDGPTPKEAVLHGAKALLDMGCYEVSLGDTLGVGTPQKTKQLLTYLVEHGIPMSKLAGHFHDTYGQALANVWQAYSCGMRAFDSSVAGLGGCPFAPGAKGNVATEDVVYMFEDASIRTGVDLPALVETGAWISQQLGKPNGSRAGAALSVKRDLSKPSDKPLKTPGTPKAATPLVWHEVQQGSVDGLLLHRSGANIKITMNRPRNGNSLTNSMVDGLTSILSSASADPKLARIIITGSGKFFCTGMDLGKGSTSVGKEDNSSSSSTTTASQAQFHRLRALFHAIDTSPKVTIACINGPAFGGGVGLALACDLRLSAPNATLTLSEVKLGLSAATISKYVVRELGIALSREVLLTARPITPQELSTRGIFMGIAKDAEKRSLEELLDSTLVGLRAASEQASRMSKELVATAWANGGTAAQDEDIERIFDAMMRPDAAGAHGVKEFQAKRKVDWDALLEGTSGVPIKSKL